MQKNENRGEVERRGALELVMLLSRAIQQKADSVMIEKALTHTQRVLS